MGHKRSEEQMQLNISSIEMKENENTGITDIERNKFEKKLTAVRSVLYDRYFGKPARSLTQIGEENPDVSIQLINIWTRKLYNKTAKEYLREQRIIRSNTDSRFYELYDVNPVSYMFDELSSQRLSEQCIKELIKHGFKTITDLLWESKTSLVKRGIKQRSIDEIIYYLNKIIKSDKEAQAKSSIQKLLIDNINCIVENDYSFIEKDISSSNDKTLLERVKDATQCLDKSLILDCVNNNVQLKELFTCLNCLIDTTHEVSSINELVNRIPVGRINNRAYYYINLFEHVHKDVLVDVFEEICKHEEVETLNDLSVVAFKYFKLGIERKVYKDFLIWCSNDYVDIINVFFDDLFTDERLKSVVQMRATKHTLEEVGKHFDVTRERVRQIETKAKKAFVNWNKNINILKLISADRAGDKMLTAEEIGCYLGNYRDEMLFLLKSTSESYNKDLDAFLYGNGVCLDEAKNYVKLLPDIIDVKEVETYIFDAVKNNSIDQETLVEVINSEFIHKMGNLISRHRISYGKLYVEILKKYFPDGMHIYSDTEIENFRQYFEMEFEESINTNNRALAARIMGVGILAGKGVYRAKKEQYIPASLANKIHDYILNSRSPMFLTTALYNLFKEDLQKEGIDNHYYLHGVMRSLYENEFVFKRDYICKDVEITSVYDTVIDYIKGFDFPISKEDITNHFEGISDLVVTFAVADEQLINYFGSYLHKDRFVITDKDKQYLKDVLNFIIEDDGTYHVRGIYEYILADNKSVLSHLNVTGPFALYSVLETVFCDEWAMERPYIAKNGIEIDRASDVLNEMIITSDEINISDVQEFARDNHYQIGNLLEYLNDFNDTHLIVNSERLMRIECLGIDQRIVSAIEEEILNEITETEAIVKLNCLHYFEDINVPWNEWLVYSTLLKWSDRLDVAPSDAQFRFATPLVAPKGKLDIGSINTALIEKNMITTDDLTSFGDLVVGFDDFDFGDIE